MRRLQTHTGRQVSHDLELSHVVFKHCFEYRFLFCSNWMNERKKYQYDYSRLQEDPRLSSTLFAVTDRGRFIEMANLITH